MSFRRLWASPLWVHAVVVGLLLLAVGFVADRPFTAFTTDEGAYALQARALQTSGRWVHVDPAAPLDPAGVASTRGYVGANGRAFYAVHPFYPLVLAGLGGLAGRFGYLALSLLGTLVAAVAAALLGRRIDERLARPSLWIVALGSPLLFDSYTIGAHAPAAALAALAVLCASAYVFPQPALSRARRVLLLLSTGLLVAVGVLVRSESLLFGLALGAGLGAAAAVSRRVRRPAGIMAGAVLVAAGVARLVDGAAIRAILGSGARAEIAPSAAQGTLAGAGYLSARFDAFRASLIAPEFGGTQRLAVLLIVGLAAALAVGALARIRSSPRSLWIAGVVAVASYGAWLAFGRPQAIPGLFVAWPFAAAAILCLSAASLAPPPLRLAGAVVVVAAGAILATEYADGGSLQWGGRYFALLVPVAVPVLAYAVSLLPTSHRRPFVICGTATALIISAMAITALHDGHRSSAVVFASLRRCAAVAGPSGAEQVDARPLVISPTDLVPRLDWPDYDRYQWMSPPLKQLDSFLRQLGAEGVQRTVLLVLGPQPAGLGGYQVADRCRGGSLTMVVLDRPA